MHKSSYHQPPFCILTKFLFIAFLLMFLSTTYALPPTTINYQGYLTDSTGSPLNSPPNVNVTFRLYTTATGGSTIWTETQIVEVANGLFSVELGTVTPLNLPDDFSTPLYLGIEVESDGEMVPRRALTLTGYSIKAIDADALEGFPAAALDQSAHVTDTSNPHAVTAAQTGAATPADIAAHAADPSAHHDKTTSFTDLTDQASDAQIPALIARDTEITWGNLSGIPAGFADGVDNDSGGDITAVFPGIGLTGGAAAGDATLGVVVPFAISSTQTGMGLYYAYNTGGSGSSGVKGESLNGPTRGYLGVQGNTDFDGITGLNTLGFEIGVMGISTGASITDNFGLYGVSNNVGVYAQGDVLAGQFFGDVSVTGNTTTSGTNNLNGTGSTTGILLGADQAEVARIYHTSTNLRVVAPGSRIQFGSVEYIEDCGANCISVGSNNVGIGTATPAARLDVAGTTRTDVLVIDGGADLAEPFSVIGSQPIQPGMVVAIDTENPGQLRIADTAYDRKVAGIVSGANGINSGLVMSQQGTQADGTLPIALTGRVYAMADASYGPIQPGDMLTTSATPGHVMKVTNFDKAYGTTIGKAMTALDEGTGLVLVLVNLQ